jgi:hypothetical protein
VIPASPSGISPARCSLGGRLVLLTWQALPRNEWIREFVTALAAGRDLPTPSSHQSAFNGNLSFTRWQTFRAG